MISNINLNCKYYVIVLVLYFVYFILGIVFLIMGQYKIEFVKVWGVFMLVNGIIDVSMVVFVIVVYGLGWLIVYLFVGLVFDRIGCCISGFIGIVLYVVFFFGMIIVYSMWWVYVIGIINGIVNLFLDICVLLSVMEIFFKLVLIVNLFIKFVIMVVQFVLLFVIGLVVSV